jgi:hypothetical protein
LYKVISLIISFSFVACENVQKPISNIEFLKDSGYKSFYCTNISYYKSDNEFIGIWETVEPIDESLSMLIARCENNRCTYEEVSGNLIPAIVYCQRFFIDQTNNHHTPEYSEESIVLTYNVKKAN